MQDWHVFTDSRLKLCFRYPRTTPDGHAVEINAQQRDDMVRVHLVSVDSSEIYFEIVKFNNLRPREEYERHSARLVEQFGAGSVTEFQETLVGQQPGHTYTFTLPDKIRTAVLLHHAGATYRIIYDPQSALNTQMLSTVVVVE